ncbi:NrfD/PsrC family molybdoenzyme membrane anchor subunit [Phosphitispora sp. TUW77]|uniref:NrfD/PsrC family molybdoenzyme membrane anchor subunit n=1 Tax=Phosphitispora sp. TUW77 TaxID=3152361 RepID=UPI003AB1A8CD
MHELVWPIILAIYLFIAGDGVAAFYSGILANTFSKGKYERIAKLGSYIGVPLILLGLLMLVIDLGRPLSFWHFILGENFLPIFRLSSTMSLGTWLLTAFTIFGGGYALTWLAEEEFTQGWPILKYFAFKPKLRKILSYLALPFAFLIACYTGILLASTAAPLWHSTPYLGLLFLMSATSAGLANIILVLAATKSDGCQIYTFAKTGAIVDMLEMLVFVILMVGLHSAAPESAALLLTGQFSTVFWVGIVTFGLLIPFIMDIYELASSKKKMVNSVIPVISAVFILIGSFLTRVVILYAGQAIF